MSFGPNIAIIGHDPSYDMDDAINGIEIGHYYFSDEGLIGRREEYLPLPHHLKGYLLGG